MKTIQIKYRDFYTVTAEIHTVDAWEGDPAVVNGFRKVTLIDEVKILEMRFTPADGTDLKVQFTDETILNKVKRAATDAFHDEEYELIDSDEDFEPPFRKDYDIYLE